MKESKRQLRDHHKIQLVRIVLNSVTHNTLLNGFLFWKIFIVVLFTSQNF